jgi:polysaccharide pyruvyl transferase WcaK-like protein
MQHPKLTVCGSFGFGNAGDEALPLAIADLAHSHGMNAEIQVLGRFPRPALPHVIGLDVQDEARRATLKGSPILVAGGGVVEPDPGCVLLRCQDYLRQSFSPHISLFAANVESGKKYNWRMQFRIKRLLQQFDRLYVRDVLSAEVLRSLLPKKSVEVIGDTVLWMKPAPTKPQCIASLGSFITVTLASQVGWKNDPSWHPWIARELAELAHQLNAAIVFLPFSVLYDPDCAEHRRVADEVQRYNPHVNVVCIEEALEPRNISTIIDASMLMVSMRLHGCVMAFARQVPFVALAYHPKLVGFAQSVDWAPFCLPANAPQSQSVGAYGYAFSDIRLETNELVDTGLKALDYNSFNKLETYKLRLSDAFIDCLQP